MERERERERETGREKKKKEKGRNEWKTKALSSRWNRELARRLEILCFIPSSYILVFLDNLEYTGCHVTGGKIDDCRRKADNAIFSQI